MKYDPQIHHRQSIRLKGYDYTQAGSYFVTICSYRREEIFGAVVGGEMVLNRAGEIASAAWHDLPHHYPHVRLDAFCVMPNHMHGVIILMDEGRGGSVSVNGSFPINPQTRPYQVNVRHGLPEIVRAFKSFSARRINLMRQRTGTPVWQRNYYDHIIRNDIEMKAICAYINHNPLRWQNDSLHPMLQ